MGFYTNHQGKYVYHNAGKPTITFANDDEYRAHRQAQRVARGQRPLGGSLRSAMQQTVGTPTDVPQRGI